MKHWLPIDMADFAPDAGVGVTLPRIILDFDGVLFNSAHEAWCVCEATVRGDARYRDVSFADFMAARGFVTDAWHYRRLYSPTHAASGFADLPMAVADADDRAFARDFFATRATMMADPQWAESMAPYEFFFALRPLLQSHPEAFAILSTRNTASIARTLAHFGVPPAWIEIYGQEHVAASGSKLAVAQAQGWLSGPRVTLYIDDMRGHLAPFAGGVDQLIHAGWGYDHAGPDSFDQNAALAIIAAVLAGAW